VRKSAVDFGRIDQIRGIIGVTVTKAGWAVAIPLRKGVAADMLTLYEALTLMISFATLIVGVIAVSQKKKK
jgi:hypothetical protein